MLKSGTIYKQQSKEEAIELGYTFVNPKLENFISQAKQIAPNKQIIIHCWRGGMRSQSFAQHLSENGFSNVKVVSGGYKAYRNYVLQNLANLVPIKLLGGYTGSGKTYILQELEKRGHQILDLEGLAHHKGSAFGGIGQAEQPTSEQFENFLFDKIQNLDLSKPVWVEDESYSIGSVNVPKQFHQQMRNAKLIFIDIPKEERAKHLVEEYANVGDNQLAESILKLSKRLGGVGVKTALDLLKQHNYFEVALLSLQYYDKLYTKGKNRRSNEDMTVLQLTTTNHHQNALTLEKLKTYE